MVLLGNKYPNKTLFCTKENCFLSVVYIFHLGILNCFYNNCFTLTFWIARWLNRKLENLSLSDFDLWPEIGLQYLWKHYGPQNIDLFYINCVRKTVLKLMKGRFWEDVFWDTFLLSLDSYLSQPICSSRAKLLLELAGSWVGIKPLAFLGSWWAGQDFRHSTAQPWNGIRM